MLVIEERLVIPDTALDHAGYRAWVTSDEYPEGVRTTFVCGEVLIEMCPESLGAHAKVKLAVTVGIARFVKDRDLGETYPDGSLVTNEEASLSCEPDLTFVSWASFETGRVNLIPRSDGIDYIEIVGSPDLVLEIVSPTSVRKDTKLLRGAYARAGVGEYWLIDARGESISFEILVNEDGTFRRAADSGAAQRSGVLPGDWELTRSRNRAGRFDYDLAHRSL